MRKKGDILVVSPLLHKSGCYENVECAIFWYRDYSKDSLPLS